MGGRGPSENGGAQPKRLGLPGTAINRIPAVSLSPELQELSDASRQAVSNLVTGFLEQLWGPFLRTGSGLETSAECSPLRFSDSVS